MMMHIIHALPNAFLPSYGQYLMVKGVSLDEVRELATRDYVTVESHIRYEDYCAMLSAMLDVEVPVGTTNCPNPHHHKDEAFVLATRNFDNSVSFYKLYNASSMMEEYDNLINTYYS